MKLFVDTEFTGLHQSTTLISIGIVAENGARFYAEFNDYDKNQVDDWIKDNVISNLYLSPSEAPGLPLVTINRPNPPSWVTIWGNKIQIGILLEKWLETNVKDDYQHEVWMDCYAYDWVLFCELFGGARNLHPSIYYIPYDLSTLLKIKGIDPDINRESFIGSKGTSKHNALHDAEVIKACYEKLAA